MKLIAGLALFVGLIALGCGESVNVLSEEEGNWSIVQSPLSGQCYETFAWGIGSRAGVIAMTEISCDYLVRNGE